MKFFKVFFYNFLILFLLFITIEVGHKLLYPGFKYYERTYVGKFENCNAIHDLDTNWVKPAANLGWVCKQKEQLRFYNPNLYNNIYCINKQGFRNSVDLEVSGIDKSKKRILIIGDSFVFGILQADSMTIPSLLQKGLGDAYQVVNLAIPAWGLDQMSLAYQQYVDIINPDEVIFFYIDDDISRLLEAFYWGAGTKPSFKLINDKLVQRDVNEDKLNYLESVLVFNSQIINRIYKFSCDKKAIPLAEAFFEKVIQSERQLGRELNIVHCPRIFQLKGNQEPWHFVLEPFFKEQNVYYSNLRDYMLELSREEQAALYDLEDGHLSDRGTEFVAEFLLERIVLSK